MRYGEQPRPSLVFVFMVWMSAGITIASAGTRSCQPVSIPDASGRDQSELFNVPRGVGNARLRKTTLSVVFRVRAWNDNVQELGLDHCRRLVS